MDKTVVGILGGVLLVLVVLCVIGGNRISCRESFWDRDKTVIELNHTK